MVIRLTIAFLAGLIAFFIAQLFITQPISALIGLLVGVVVFVNTPNSESYPFG